MSLLILLATFSLQSEVIEGRIFDLKKMDKEPLFSQRTELTTSADGRTEQSSAIVDPEGHTVMLEKTVFSGAKVEKQEITDLVSKKKYAAEIHGKEMTFFTYELKDDGSAKLLSSHKEENAGVVLTGPVTESFVRENWEQLKEGRTLEAQFGVFEMEKTIGFKFRKTSLSQQNGKEALKVEMRPSNFFVKLLITPMELTFDAETKTLVHFRGRTPLKIGRGSDASPLDADITYQRAARMPASTKGN